MRRLRRTMSPEVMYSPLDCPFSCTIRAQCPGNESVGRCVGLRVVGDERRSGTADGLMYIGCSGVHHGRHDDGYHDRRLHRFYGFFRGFPDDLAVHDLFDALLASLQVLLVEDDPEDIGAVRQRGQNKSPMIDVWSVTEDRILESADEFCLGFWIHLGIDLPGKKEQDSVLIGLENASLAQLARDAMLQAPDPPEP